MECLLPLILLGLAVGVPILLGGWSRRSFVGRIVLALGVAGSARIAGWKFREVRLLEESLNQRVVYPLASDSPGPQTLVVPPLQGRGISGLEARVVLRREGASASADLLERMEWKAPGNSAIVWSRQPGEPLVEWRDQDAALVLTYRAAGGDSLELHVGPDRMSRKDVGIGRAIEFWLGLFPALASAIGLGFLLLGRRPPP